MAQSKKKATPKKAAPATGMVVKSSVKTGLTGAQQRASQKTGNALNKAAGKVIPRKTQ